jgi:hypothetical protein
LIPTTTTTPLVFATWAWGMPEIGWVSLGELASVRGGLGLPIERDLSFRAEKRLSAYARDARLAGRIVV